MSIPLRLMRLLVNGCAALRLSQRDEGDKSSIPLGLLAFFSSDISFKQVTELIRTQRTTHQEAINQMRAEHRASRTAFKMPAQLILNKPSWSRLLRPKGQRLHLLRRRLISHHYRKALPLTLLSLVHRPLNRSPSSIWSSTWSSHLLGLWTHT